jgi:hypothetical protein
MVRIRFPPAKSPPLSPSCFRGLRTPAFRAAVRGGLGELLHTGDVEPHREGPMVRIHLPPARSLRTTSSEAAKPPAPFYGRRGGRCESRRDADRRRAAGDHRWAGRAPRRCGGGTFAAGRAAADSGRRVGERARRDRLPSSAVAWPRLLRHPVKGAMALKARTPGVEPGGSVAVLRTTGIGASRPLPRSPARLNRQRALSFGRGSLHGRQMGLRVERRERDEEERAAGYRAQSGPSRAFQRVRSWSVRSSF